MMRNAAFPTVSLSTAVAHRPDSCHSLLIAFVRALAAIEVAAAHLRALFYPGTRTISDPALWYQGFAFFTGFGHQAVLLFFVISGWLVGGSLLDKWRQPDAIAHYAIDRVSRLWTVLIPVFALTLLLGFVNGQIAGGGIDLSPQNEFSATTLLGNLIGLQVIVVPTFGDNFPLWSLSNETWYYILFPLLLVMVRTERLTVRTGAALALALLAITLPPTLKLYFAIWLLGALFSRIQIDCGTVWRVVIILVSLAASAYCRLTGINEDISAAAFIPDLILSTLFLVILCTLRNTGTPASSWFLPIAAAGRYLAEFSFTLYVIHVPLIHLMQFWMPRILGTRQLSPHDPWHLAACFAMLGVLIFCAWLFYLLFEARTPLIRKWLKRKLLRPVPRVAMATQ